MTQTAHALLARNYKGLANYQEMTIAAYLLSTKESGQTNEQLQTASKQARTEDCRNGNRKEL